MDIFGFEVDIINFGKVVVINVVVKVSILEWVIDIDMELLWVDSFVIEEFLFFYWDFIIQLLSIYVLEGFFLGEYIVWYDVYLFDNEDFNLFNNRKQDNFCVFLDFFVKEFVLESGICLGNQADY